LGEYVWKFKELTRHWQITTAHEAFEAAGTCNRLLICTRIVA
jgi:hypothetical protein